MKTSIEKNKGDQQTQPSWWSLCTLSWWSLCALSVLFATRTPGGSLTEIYRRWFGSLLLCSCDVFRAIISSLCLLTSHKCAGPPVLDFIVLSQAFCCCCCWWWWWCACVCVCLCACVRACASARVRARVVFLSWFLFCFCCCCSLLLNHVCFSLAEKRISGCGPKRQL